MKRIACALLTTLALSTSSYGNSSSYYDKDGVTVFPFENNNIVMQKEVIKITGDKKLKKKWQAICDYTFVNKTETEQVVTMGYPDWIDETLDVHNLDPKISTKFWKYFETYPKKEQQDYEEQAFVVGRGYSEIYHKGYRKGKLPYTAKAWNLQDLKVSVDAVKISTQHKPIDIEIKIPKKYENEFSASALEPAGAYIWKLNFKPQESKTVRVSFSFEGLNDAAGYQEVSYILKTGALWADVIGEADIYWDISGRKVNMKRVTPAGYKLKEKVLHWHFENFKPDKDISIFVSSSN